MGWLTAATLWATIMGGATAWAQGAPGECEQPNVIIALDRSGSMLQDSKWETAVDAITQLTRSFEHRIRFGMTVFPWGDRCTIRRPDAVLAEIEPFNGQNIQRALTGFGVRPQRDNLTPIAAAIAGATGDLRALNDLDRRNFIVLLTDGIETCDGDPVQAAANAAGEDYNVFVIGFGGGVDRNTLNRMAQVGGTERAYQANNGRELFEAFSAIVDAATREVCDGRDNDCDFAIDEGLAARLCETECGRGEQICLDGGLTECRGGDIPDEVCDGTDNDCDLVIDEVVATPCTTVSGNPGTHPCVEGQLAEECVPDELFREETCDNVDNDDDGSIDENQDVPCAIECHAGRRLCLQGSLTRCTAEPVGPERCNGIDDDCDGTVDEGAECAGSSVCGPEGQCLIACAQGECPDFYTCAPDGYCHPNLCEPFCDPGALCVREICRTPCLVDGDCPEGVTCANRLCAIESGAGGADGGEGGGEFELPPPIVQPEPTAPEPEAPDMGAAAGDAAESGCACDVGRAESSGPGWLPFGLLFGWLPLRRRRR